MSRRDIPRLYGDLDRLQKYIDLVEKGLHTSGRCII